MEAIAESRRSVRFRTHGCTLVALGDDGKLGEVLNISLGGLAFRCIGGEEPLTTSGKLNVYCDDGMCLVKLSFDTRWDMEVSDSAPFNYITTRRFGVRFDDLTAEQMSALCRFIQHHTYADPEG